MWICSLQLDPYYVYDTCNKLQQKKAKVQNEFGVITRKKPSLVQDNGLMCDFSNENGIFLTSKQTTLKYNYKSKVLHTKHIFVLCSS